MAQFSHSPNRLHPTEDLFDPLTLLLTTGATTDPGRQIQFGLKFLF